MLAWLESMKFWTPVELAVRDDLRLWWLGRDVALPDEVVVARPGAVAGGVQRCCLPVSRSARRPRWGSGPMRPRGSPKVCRGSVWIPMRETLPNELGLYGTALDKGCYPGQETVARVHTWAARRAV